jgi:RHS repeat-associated protein
MGGNTSFPGRILSLPQGGGALSGLGETFSPDLFTGTGNMNVPLLLPPGRNGHEPSLRLSYSTGNGNGPCGFGWQIEMPSVTRRTSTGVPRYDDSLDQFVLSGADILVPSGSGDGSYQPWTDASFQRIHHSDDQAGNGWLVVERNGTKSWYGYCPGIGAKGVLVNPSKPEQIFAWYLLVSEDVFGNRIEYDYLQDSGSIGDRRWNQLLPSRVRYADFGDKQQPSFLISVSFEYEDEDRPDPFSQYRAGFEIRTTKRCARIDIQSHPHGEDPKLSRRYSLEYLPESAVANGVSLLSRIVVSAEVDGDTQSLPPLQCDYTPFAPSRRNLMAIECPSPPGPALSDPSLDVVDVDGNGLPDILQLNGTARFWRNCGGGRFSTPREMDRVPAGIHLGDAGVTLLDAIGDGHTALVVSGGPIAGYYPMGPEGTWDQRSFHPYRVAPSFDFKDPRVRLVDLNGDGVTDVFYSGESLICYFNNPKTGWGDSLFLRPGAIPGLDHLDFTDDRLRLADMNGDGLQDLVMVHSGSITYWPSLGWGRWGAPILMHNSPRFPDQYDPKRVLLGDVDGDGAADLIYVDDGQVTVWPNKSGNRYGDPLVITGSPSITDTDALRLVDLLGVGTTGLLWSKPVGWGDRPSLYFLDFTGKTKPYLLSTFANGTGAESEIEYTSSAEFYLADAQNPKTRWQTSLPFPVQVVRRVIQRERLTGNVVVTDYAYHHGYWDGIEHAFRGFGRVDRTDGSTYQAGSPQDLPASPPTVTRTWFHLGPIDDQWTQRPRTIEFPSEYWPGDKNVFPQPDIPDSWTPVGQRTALRALRGATLRSEMYALDGSTLQDTPYTVDESAYGVRLTAPPDGTNPGVAFSHRAAERHTRWERGDDPLTVASFTDDYDAYGLPRKKIDVGVPRGRDFREPDPHAPDPYLVQLDTTDYAQRNDSFYIVDRVARNSEFEVINDGTASLLKLHEQILLGALPLQVIGQSCHYYDGDAFVGLPIGTLGDYGARVRSETLDITDGQLRKAYRSDQGPVIPPYLVPDLTPPWTPDYPTQFRTDVPVLAGYRYGPVAGVQGVDGYWSTTTALRYDFQEGQPARGQQVVERDPFGNETQTSYDAYSLLPTLVTNPAGLTSSAEYDYRVLKIRLVTNANGNRILHVYTPLGDLASQAVMGKVGENVGDTPEAPSLRIVYDYLAYVRDGSPISRRQICRQFYISDTHVPPNERDRTLDAIEFTDGFGRTLQTREQADVVSFGDPIFGTGLIPADQKEPGGTTVGVPTAPGEPPRVLVSGWRIYDNFGRVVQQYQPFFDHGWNFAIPSPQQSANAITTEYDPIGRVCRTTQPNGSEIWTVYGVPVRLDDPSVFEPTPWDAYSYDVNDNAGRTDPIGSESYRSHWNTPANSVIDVLGRVVSTTVRNGRDAADWYTSVFTFDIQGNRLTAVDPLNRTAFQYEYDLQNRAWRAEQIDSGVVRFVFDAVGNTVERRNSRGSLKLVCLDSLLRPLLGWARNTLDEPVTLRLIWIYGDNTQSGLTREQALERNLLGAIYQQYDEAGLVTEERRDFKGLTTEATRQVFSDAAILAGSPGTGWPLQDPASLLDPRVFQTSTLFDAVNRVETMRYPADPDGVRAVMALHYTLGNTVESVAVDEISIVERIVHDSLSRRSLISYGNGIMTRYAFQPLSQRVARMRSEGYTMPAPLTYQPSGAPAIQDEDFDYDLAGNVMAIHDRYPGCGVPPDVDRLDRQFVFDPLYRLTQASGRECGATADPPWNPGPRGDDPLSSAAYAESYTYDSVGNLQTIAHVGNAANFTRRLVLVDGTNQLLNLQQDSVSYAYEYDGAGNLKQEAARKFESDHGNRIIHFGPTAAASGPQAETFFLYDETGQRVKKLTVDADGVVESVVYVASVFEWHHTRTPSGMSDEAWLHVLVDAQRVAILRRGMVAGVRFDLTDSLGSSIVTLDGAGTVQLREEYSPYGETSWGGSVEKRYRFSEKERDAETGWYYFGARYLLPYAGRWATCDPSGPVDGFNLYSYVSNNPMAYVDPTGRFKWRAMLRRSPVLRGTMAAGALMRGVGVAFNMWSRTEMSARLSRHLVDQTFREKVYVTLKGTLWLGLFVKNKDVVFRSDVTDTGHYHEGRVAHSQEVSEASAEERAAVSRNFERLLAFHVVPTGGFFNGDPIHQLRLHETSTGLFAWMFYWLAGVPHVAIRLTPAGFRATVVPGRHIFRGSRTIETDETHHTTIGEGERPAHRLGLAIDYLNNAVGKAAIIRERQNYRLELQQQRQLQPSRGTQAAPVTAKKE